MMNKINPVVMQMFHEDCQCVEENLPPVPDAQDKKFQGMKNHAEGEGRSRPPGVPSEGYPTRPGGHVGDKSTSRATNFLSFHQRTGRGTLFCFVFIFFS